MEYKRTASTERRRRLAEELAESGFAFEGEDETVALVLSELDYALRPIVHERRIPSYGSIVEPTVQPALWEELVQLKISRRHVPRASSGPRLFADGLSSWVIRRNDGADELAVFDRPAGSERDMVVLADAMGATLVQRHPSGPVRVAGTFGVLRWDGVTWHNERDVGGWIDSIDIDEGHGDRNILQTLLEFAVHDLGSRGIGAILLYRPADDVDPNYEVRLPTPPPLQIDHPADLAPLRHVLGQLDGAAVFDATGTLQELGVRLAPSLEAASAVEMFRGMRHTAGRRYSFDDPMATVIIVSEDGPVTVLRNGELLGSNDPL